MFKQSRLLKKLDQTLLAVVALIIIFSLVTIYSATKDDTLLKNDFAKQILNIVIGLAAMIFMLNINYEDDTNYYFCVPWGVEIVITLMNINM